MNKSELSYTNWHKDFLNIYGISPLGDHAEQLFVKSKYPKKPTKKALEAKEKFVKDLKSQSWVVTNDKPKEKIENLSLPITWLFEKVGS